MKKLFTLFSAVALSTLAACSTTPQPQANVAPERAMLLVSLDDGSVVLQMIDSAADICFKLASQTSTTCLSQGAPILDTDGDTVIGFEMHEEKIDLVASSDR